MLRLIKKRGRSETRRRFTKGWILTAVVSASQLFCGTVAVSAQSIARAPVSPAIPQKTMIGILMAEDTRRWGDELESLLRNQDPHVRQRAALAAGRIGDERAVALLTQLLQKDRDEDVRATAAFALGEIESVAGAPGVLAVLNNTKEQAEVRARAVEALGKIAAALSDDQVEQKERFNEAILALLNFEAGRRALPDRQTILLGLTAALRARPANAGPVVAQFLSSSNARIRADAANVLARLRLNDGADKLRELLVRDADGNVRANAARALGAAEDSEAFSSLLDRALTDQDLRVRVSAIRALGSLKDRRAAEPLLKRGCSLTRQDLRTLPVEVNEVLEIATALGRILQGVADKETLEWFSQLLATTSHYLEPEVDVAFARLSAKDYLTLVGSKRNAQETIFLDWKRASGIAQGLREVAALPQSAPERSELVAKAEDILRGMLDYRDSEINIKTLVAVHSEYAITDVLRALAAFKLKDLGDLARNHLKESDVVVRATAADLLGDVPTSETNTRALTAALPRALRDEMNDAALSILDSLGKQKTAVANKAIQTALDSSDYLVRRRAVAILKANRAGDFSSRIGTVKTSNTTRDFERALERSGKDVRATVTTSKGEFVIELLPEKAPLNVDNFIRLAQRGFFNGLAIPRVVANFVIQAGDQRGDLNGSPGYQIRCEINDVPFERATVGMALSGKDTGGSQWFITHSPQPHLDGGYTVFGRVVGGMDVVDRIVRGDLIVRVSVVEGAKNDSSRRHHSRMKTSRVVKGGLTGVVHLEF